MVRLQCAQRPNKRNGGHGMTTKKKPTRSGKPMNLYMRADDVAKIRELISYAAGNGHRTSDSRIVRACLMAASPNRTFLTALKEAEKGDLRFKHGDE